MINFFIFFAITILIFAFGYCTKTQTITSLIVLVVAGLLAYRFYSIGVFVIMASMLFFICLARFLNAQKVKKATGEKLKFVNNTENLFITVSPLFIELMFITILSFNFRGLKFNFNCFKFAFLSSAIIAFTITIIPEITKLFEKQLSLNKKGDDFVITAFLGIGIITLYGIISYSVNRSAIQTILLTLSAMLGYLTVNYLYDFLDKRKTKKTNLSQNKDSENGTGENATDIESVIADNATPQTDETTKSTGKNTYKNLLTTYLCMIISIIIALIIKV